MPSHVPSHPPGHRPKHVRELTVIIPVLNETTTITSLVKGLLQQQGIDFEIIIVDGGSRSNNITKYQTLVNKYPDRLNFLQTNTGRARQMNLGVQYARAPDLLFLHADTVIEDTELLRHALGHLRQQRHTQQRDNIAGHFGLRFIRSTPGFDAAYYFYEAKTHLNRPDCINGDQGLLLSRKFFESLGGFDESLPFMEDARLSARIFEQGQWILLPGLVYTSARRFETEGMKQRQILNSFICNFQNIGLHEFFTRAQDAYRVQNKTGTLKLKPFCNIIHQLMRDKGFVHAVKRWYQTGGYIADNAWQLAFTRDCKNNRLAGLAPGDGERNNLQKYERWLAPLITSPPCRAITGLLTLVWFYNLRFRSDG